MIFLMAMKLPGAYSFLFLAAARRVFIVKMFNALKLILFLAGE